MKSAMLFSLASLFLAGYWVKTMQDKKVAIASLWQERYEQALLAISDPLIIINIEGLIVYVNQEAVKLLGFEEVELIGKDYQLAFPNHSVGMNYCNLLEEFLTSKQPKPLENYASVLTSKLGQAIHISLNLIPSFKGEELEFIYCQFRELTKREVSLVNLEQTGCFDSLTGLYNRQFFDHELPNLDTWDNLPFSILMGDLNGLKLTNDIFGHSVGDELLITVAQNFKKITRESDRVFRWGGDEFVVLLPRTDFAEAENLQKELAKSLSNKRVGPISISMPMGVATKTLPEQDIQVVWQEAEERMYWTKTVTQGEFQKNTLENVVETLFKRSEGERGHSERVGALAERFGEYLKLSPPQLRKLRQAGMLHDVGKVALEPALLHKPFPLTPEDEHEMRRHPLVGFRLLNFFEETLDLADGVLAHHEHWDGSGYPKGLQGEEIPFIGRVLAIIETYDRIVYDPHVEGSESEVALALIAKESGRKFDPELTESFLKLMKET